MGFVPRNFQIEPGKKKSMVIGFKNYDVIIKVNEPSYELISNGVFYLDGNKNGEVTIDQLLSVFNEIVPEVNNSYAARKHLNSQFYKLFDILKQKFSNEDLDAVLNRFSGDENYSILNKKKINMRLFFKDKQLFFKFETWKNDKETMSSSLKLYDRIINKVYQEALIGLKDKK